MKQTNSRAAQIQQILKMAYPHVKTQLSHRNPFELLVAAMLSAQCTDRQVNRVTPALFEALPTPDAFARVSLERIESLIHSTGFYRNKARNIQNCAQTLVDNFRGVVPQTLEELVSLPGVGRKTANVVLSSAFGIPGIVVDTHVARISGRLGLTANTNPIKIEFDLMEVIPQYEWREFCLRVISLGREVCQARKPRCPQCPLAEVCPYPDKTPA